MLTQEEFSKAFDEAASDPSYEFRGQLGAEPTINWSWSTGGLGGGSCWDEGETRHYSIEGEEAPLVTELDTFFESNVPELTFIHYKEIIVLAVKTKTVSINEYYGNCSNYACRFVTKDDLFGLLNERGYITANR